MNIRITRTIDYPIYLLGRQEKKVVNERRREIKRLKSEQEDVSYWKVRFLFTRHHSHKSFVLDCYLDISWCIISGFSYLYFIYVLFNAERFLINTNRTASDRYMN